MSEQWVSHYEQFTSQEAQIILLNLYFLSALLLCKELFPPILAVLFVWNPTGCWKVRVRGREWWWKTHRQSGRDTGCILLSVELCKLGDLLEARIVFRFPSVSLMQSHLLILCLARSVELFLDACLMCNQLLMPINWLPHSPGVVLLRNTELKDISTPRRLMASCNSEDRRSSQGTSRSRRAGAGSQSSKMSPHWLSKVPVGFILSSLFYAEYSLRVNLLVGLIFKITEL